MSMAVLGFEPSFVFGSKAVSGSFSPRKNLPQDFSIEEAYSHHLA
jgi:hypothetical protein